MMRKTGLAIVAIMYIDSESALTKQAYEVLSALRLDKAIAGCLQL